MRSFATFEFTEQLVGFPMLSIDAPEGTVVEIITQESHDPKGSAWLDSHIYQLDAPGLPRGHQSFSSPSITNRSAGSSFTCAVRAGR